MHFVSPPGGTEALGYGLSLAWAAVPPLLLVVLSFLHPLFLARYMVVSVPGIALTEAMAGYRVWTFVAGRGRAIDQGQSLDQAGLESQAPPVKSRIWASPGPAMTALLICGIVGAISLQATRVELGESYYVDNYRSAAAALNRDLSERPAPVVITPNWAAVGFSYYASTPTLAAALVDPSSESLTVDWQQFPAGGLLSWPIGVKPVTHAGRCIIGWAIGRGTAPSQAFNVDGSSCRLYQVQYYGEVWVASVSG